jgi:shikimate dehydrogenase
VRIEEHYQAVEVAIGPKDPEGYNLIVNATPIGMKDGDPLPVDIDRIARGSYVGDVVLKAEVTPFLQAAKDKGCKIQVGSDMLFEMIPACLEFFASAVPHPTTSANSRAPGAPLLSPALTVPRLRPAGVGASPRDVFRRVA